MARQKEIDVRGSKDGVIEIELSHWKHFSKFISRELLNYQYYIFRGQSRYSWKLESSFDRLVKRKKIKSPNSLYHPKTQNIRQQMQIL